MIKSFLEAGLVTRLSRAESLLIGLDFDGTLTPIVERPEEAIARPETMALLVELGSLHNTTVAVISGRALEDLEARIGRRPGVRLIGSHGAEWDDQSAGVLGPAEEEELARVTGALEAIAVRYDGAWVERKPTAAAFHYRGVRDGLSHAAVAEVMAGPGRLSGVSVRPGKMVVEVGVTAATKGDALARLRRELGVERAMFIGDDFTDEDAFAVLGPADVAIKVGPGPTTAPFRVEGPEAVEAVLRELARARGASIQRG